MVCEGYVWFDVCDFVTKVTWVLSVGLCKISGIHSWLLQTLNVFLKPLLQMLSISSGALS